MKQTKAWIKSGRTFTQFNNVESIVPQLEPSLYNLCFDPREGRTYLEKFADRFQFDFKIYGLEEKFLNYVMTSYENSTGNFGILFNGFKGSGKTVCAKILANQMNLPVIIVNGYISTLSNFVSNLNSDCILFFDEFEKSFHEPEEQQALLSIMDGCYNSEYRKVFLLTTNQTSIDDNFLGRPSRIRFRREFGNLSFEALNEYIDDNLKYPEFKEDIISTVNLLQMSTIDILKTIVQEVNIHNCSPEDFKDYLNIEFSHYLYNMQESYYYPNEDERGISLEFSEVFEMMKQPDLVDWNKPNGLTQPRMRRTALKTLPILLNEGDEINGYKILYADKKNGQFVVDYGCGDLIFYRMLNYQTPSLYL